jgi:hypothetical protein
MERSKALVRLRLFTLIGLLILSIYPTFAQSQPSAKASKRWCAVTTERLLLSGHQPGSDEISIWGERNGLHVQYGTTNTGREADVHMTVASSLRGLDAAGLRQGSCRVMLLIESTYYENVN